MKRRGIIRSGSFAFVILFTTMQISCKEKEQKSIIDEVESEFVIPDSTAYFDSAYATLAFSLDTFFEKVCLPTPVNSSKE